LESGHDHHPAFDVDVDTVISYLYDAWKPNSKRKLEDGDDDRDLGKKPKVARQDDLDILLARATVPSGGEA
jgi:hypothetical protein